MTMRLLHVTNIVSPHQVPLARALAAQLGAACYRLAVLEPTAAAGEALAWEYAASDPWILRVAEDERHRQEYGEWFDGADIVVCGQRLIEPFAQRVSRGQLTFYMSERWWKPPVGMLRLLHPRFAAMAWRFRRLAASPYFHYLAIGPHAAADMKRLVCLPGRAWNWGYFTASGNAPPVRPREGGLRIVWAGRMLGWKRVDTLVRGFSVLHRGDSGARLALIGDGPRLAALRKLVRKLGLQSSVGFEPRLPMQAVLERMRDSHVYVLSSNGYEGWGAVVNEAMSEGCAVVATDAAGAAAAMIQPGENGLLFRVGDWRTLGSLLLRLNQDQPFRQRLGQAARLTMERLWSPATGAQRLLAVGDALLCGRPAPTYDAGPMGRI
jgi:glycosyltransferase involved in cell wall biosynthesis